MRPLLAITVSDQDVIAIVGLVIAVGVGLPAWLNWLARHRNTQRIDDVHEWVRPNGRGTLVEMLEAGLDRIENIEVDLGERATRLDRIERDLERVRGSLASITAQGIDHEVQDERRFAEAARRMGASEIKLTDLDGELAVVARELAQIVAELGRIRGG